MSKSSDFGPLNLPQLNPLRVRRSAGGRLQVWDGIRKQWLVLTPEEWVRQNFISYLVSYHGVLSSSVVQEYFIGALGRADIVVFSHSASLEPRLIVECKAISIALTQDVLEQVGRYNSLLSVDYVAITNGLSHYFFQLDHSLGTYTSIPELPQF